MLDTTEATVGGVLTLAATGFIQLYEHFSMNNVNDVITFLLAVGGGVFLYHRIKGQILDNKIKRKKLNDD
jgi:hypothetical protein